jgi:hypothetical protein
MGVRGFIALHDNKRCVYSTHRKNAATAAHTTEYSSMSLSPTTPMVASSPGRRHHPGLWVQRSIPCQPLPAAKSIFFKKPDYSQVTYPAALTMHTEDKSGETCHSPVLRPCVRTSSTIALITQPASAEHQPL